MQELPRDVTGRPIPLESRALSPFLAWALEVIRMGPADGLTPAEIADGSGSGTGEVRTACMALDWMGFVDRARDPGRFRLSENIVGRPA